MSDDKVVPLSSKKKNSLGVVVSGGPDSQKGRILHIVVGDEDWRPTADEYQEAVRLFQDALADPKGAIVATRTGIEPYIFDLNEKSGVCPRCAAAARSEPEDENEEAE